MKITNSDCHLTMRFDEVSYGQVFIHEGSTYIRVVGYYDINVVDLGLYRMDYIEAQCLVYPKNSELILTPIFKNGNPI